MKKIIAWADVGSHGYIFEFIAGPVASRYPHLLHIYSQPVTPDLKRVEIKIIGEKNAGKKRSRNRSN